MARTCRDRSSPRFSTGSSSSSRSCCASCRASRHPSSSSCSFCRSSRGRSTSPWSAVVSSARASKACRHRATASEDLKRALPTAEVPRRTDHGLRHCRFGRAAGAVPSREGVCRISGSSSSCWLMSSLGGAVGARDVRAPAAAAAPPALPPPPTPTHADAGAVRHATRVYRTHPRREIRSTRIYMYIYRVWNRR